jgi:hypothetical protein
MPDMVSSIEQDGSDEKHDNDVALEKPAKRWGVQSQPHGQRILASPSIGDDADAAADLYEHRNVSGLTLSVVASGEMVGEHLLGCREPENVEEADPADEARKLLEKVKSKKEPRAFGRRRSKGPEIVAMDQGSNMVR